MKILDVIAFDADDTLWHNETLYSLAQGKLQELLAAYQHGEELTEKLYQTEMANLPTFGYGIKSFALSMIETAIKVTKGRIKGQDIQSIINLAKEMQQAPVYLLEHVAEVIPALAESYTLMLVTKGDLFDQEAKIARSGLASCFSHVEVVIDKTPEVYRSLLARYRIEPHRFLMVGNSMRSDVLPAVSIGARAVYIPYHLTWVHETMPEQSEGLGDYAELEHIGLLPEFVERLHTQEA